MKVTITKRALLGRINRKLAAEGAVLKAAYGFYASREFGDFYLLKDNAVVSGHIDVEDFGRKLGVLGLHEQLAMCNCAGADQCTGACRAETAQRSVAEVA